MQAAIHDKAVQERRRACLEEEKQLFERLEIDARENGKPRPRMFTWDQVGPAMHLAEALSQGGRLGDAIKILNKVIFSCPGNLEARRRLRVLIDAQNKAENIPAKSRGSPCPSGPQGDVNAGSLLTC